MTRVRVVGCRGKIAELSVTRNPLTRGPVVSYAYLTRYHICVVGLVMRLSCLLPYYVCLHVDGRNLVRRDNSFTAADSLHDESRQDGPDVHCARKGICSFFDCSLFPSQCNEPVEKRPNGHLTAGLLQYSHRHHFLRAADP